MSIITVSYTHLEIDHIPGVDTVIYNQIIFLPNQKREMAKLDKKKNRHA